MMENDTSSSGGLLSGGMGLGRQSTLAGLSPYLNVDTNYLQSSPEYLFDQDTKRGAMEKSFSAIGSSVCIGATLGGAYGLYNGVRETATTDLTGKLRRTQVINYCLKGGSTTGNALGSVAVIYSLTHTFLGLSGYEQDDEMKSIISGTVTGALFKSTAGVKKCLRGAGIGAALAAVWAYEIKKEKFVENYI